MITSGTNSFFFGDGAVFVVSSVAVRCACSRSAFLFFGRSGKTHCLHCEAAHFNVAPSECDPTDDGPDAATAFQKAIV
jgi:hypothetical protein